MPKAAPHSGIQRRMSNGWSMRHARNSEREPNTAVIVVFDSGIWISAMEFGGTPLGAVIRAIAQDRFAVCDQIEEEVVRVLTRQVRLGGVAGSRRLGFLLAGRLARGTGRDRYRHLPRS